jgi:DnaK suppressor protein
MDETMIRDLLDVELATTLTRIRAMKADLEAIDAGSANANTDDEHDPEGSTLAYERAQVAALLVQAQSNLEDLNCAQGRLAEGTYSTCEQCHSEISAKRLLALPAGRVCIDCANNATREHLS